jgi:hypothetical protein
LRSPPPPLHHELGASLGEAARVIIFMPFYYFPNYMF